LYILRYYHIKYFLSLLFLISTLGVQAQVPVYKEPKGKNKTTKPPKSRPEKRTEYYDEAKKIQRCDETWLGGKLNGKAVSSSKTGVVQTQWIL